MFALNGIVRNLVCRPLLVLSIAFGRDENGSSRSIDPQCSRHLLSFTHCLDHFVDVVHVITGMGTRSGLPKPGVWGRFFDMWFLRVIFDGHDLRSRGRRRLRRRILPGWWADLLRGRTLRQRWGRWRGFIAIHILKFRLGRRGYSSRGGGLLMMVFNGRRVLLMDDVRDCCGCWVLGRVNRRAGSRGRSFLHRGRRGALRESRGRGFIISWRLCSMTHEFDVVRGGETEIGIDAN